MSTIAVLIVTASFALPMLFAGFADSLLDGETQILIILSANPLAILPEATTDIKILMTMIGGKVEHCSPGHEPLCPCF